MAQAMVLTTKALMNRPVVAVRGKRNSDRRIGKVRRFVFHPTQKRCIGIIAKRPDVALMFHRSDLFVALDSFTFEDGELRLQDESRGTGSAAIKRLGVEWEKCVMWLGMQLVTENGTQLGRVGDISFNGETGKVESLLVDEGATARALLGTTVIPANLIKGFRWGIGDSLRQSADDMVESAIDEEEENLEDKGAILLSDEALDLVPEGGLAESAARSSVMAAAKTKQIASNVKDQAVNAVGALKPKAADAATAAKPKVEEAAKKTGEVVSHGAALAGEHLAKSKTMFSDFMDEYRKAAAGEEGSAAQEEASVVQKAPESNERSEYVEKVKKASDSVAGSVKKRTKGMFSGFMDEYRKALNDDED